MQSQATEVDANAGATQTLDSREAVEPKQADAVVDLQAVEGEAALLGALEGNSTAAMPQTAAEAVPSPDGVEGAAKPAPEGSRSEERTSSNKRNLTRFGKAFMASFTEMRDTQNQGGKTESDSLSVPEDSERT